MSKRLQEIRELREGVLAETSGKIYPLNSFQQDFSIHFPSRFVSRILEIGDKVSGRVVSPKDMDELVGLFAQWESFVEQIHNKAVNNQDWALGAEKAKSARNGYIHFMKTGLVSDLKRLIDKLGKAQEAMQSRTPSTFK
jgi:hypothetical protein